jgi:hypothetical protein
MITNGRTARGNRRSGLPRQPRLSRRSSASADVRWVHCSVAAIIAIKTAAYFARFDLGAG